MINIVQINMEERLQKYLAECGIASRRKAEELIIAGRVRVNGIIVNSLGTKVGPNDEVTVDDVVVSKLSNIYLVLNKPRGYISSVSDEHNRKTVMDLIPDEYKKESVSLVADKDKIRQALNDGEVLGFARYSASVTIR